MTLNSEHEPLGSLAHGDCPKPSEWIRVARDHRSRAHLALPRQASPHHSSRPRLEKVVTGNDPGGVTKAISWEGGGGFRTLTVGPTMYESGPGKLVLLAEWAVGEMFSQAVAGQLGFVYDPDGTPLCGTAGRMRLAVIDGAVGPEEVSELLGHTNEHELLTIVGKAVLPGAEDALARLSRGSRLRKAPRDLLTSPRCTRWS